MVDAVGVCPELGVQPMRNHGLVARSNECHMHMITACMHDTTTNKAVTIGRGAAGCHKARPLCGHAYYHLW